MGNLPNWVIPAVIVAAVLLILLIVVLVIAVNRGRAKQREEDQRRAAELREKAEQERTNVQEKELHARESQLEADRARLDADRREQAAREHNRAAAQSREKLDHQLAEADRLDPDRAREGERRTVAEPEHVGARGHEHGHDHGHGHDGEFRRDDTAAAHERTQGERRTPQHEDLHDRGTVPEHGEQRDRGAVPEHEDRSRVADPGAHYEQPLAPEHGRTERSGLGDADHGELHDGGTARDGATARQGSQRYGEHPAGAGLNENDLQRDPVDPAQGTGRRRADVDPDEMR